MTNQEKLDKWFLDNENCTFKEFCDIYLLGDTDLSKVTFIDIPSEIKKLNLNIVFPILFEEFLVRENIRDLFIERLLENTVSVSNTKALISHFKIHRNDEKLDSYKAFFHYSINFSKTKEEKEFWETLEDKWITFYYDKTNPTR